MTGVQRVRWRHSHPQYTPIEALERAYPMRVLRCRLRRGGGAGWTPGGGRWGPGGGGWGPAPVSTWPIEV